MGLPEPFIPNVVRRGANFRALGVIRGTVDMPAIPQDDVGVDNGGNFCVPVTNKPSIILLRDSTRRYLLLQNIPAPGVTGDNIYYGIGEPPPTAEYARHCGTKVPLCGFHEVARVLKAQLWAVTETDGVTVDLRVMVGR